MTPMMPRVRSIHGTTVLAACTLAGAFFGCKSTGRGLRVGDASATVNVTLTGLQAADEGNGAWVYELSGCDGLPTLNGTLVPAQGAATPNVTGPIANPYPLDGTPAAPASTTVTFTAVGLKATLPNCQLRVKALQPAAGITFAYEPNVLYWTRLLDITENADGQLVATAALQQVYSQAPTADASKSFTVVVPVKFSVPEAGAPVTGSLVCGKVAYVGQYAGSPKDASSGTMTFTVAIDTITDFVCTDLYADINGIAHEYHGVLSAADGKIHGIPATPTTLPTQTLVFQAPVTPAAPGTAPATATATATSPATATATDSGIVVTTTSGTCPTGQVYDSTKHSCG